MGQRWRSGVDLETQGWSMVTVPITLTEGYGLEGHYSNGVVVVLQMVLGLHRSVYSDTLCCPVLWCDVM